MYQDFTPFFKGGIFAAFEPMGRRDYALIPWWILRFVVFWVAWRIALVADRARRKIYGRRMRPWAGYGRRTDLCPVMCPRCLWAGPCRWLVHTYYACGDDDVEPVDECPRCGADI